MQQTKGVSTSAKRETSASLHRCNRSYPAAVHRVCAHFAHPASAKQPSITSPPLIFLSLYENLFPSSFDMLVINTMRSHVLALQTHHIAPSHAILDPTYISPTAMLADATSYMPSRPHKMRDAYCITGIPSAQITDSPSPLHCLTTEHARLFKGVSNLYTRLTFVCTVGRHSTAMRVPVKISPYLV